MMKLCLGAKEINDASRVQPTDDVYYSLSNTTHAILERITKILKKTTSKNYHDFLKEKYYFFNFLWDNYKNFVKIYKKCISKLQKV